MMDFNRKINMKYIMKKYMVYLPVFILGTIAFMSSCSKDEYYKEGGKANPIFNGTVLQYLESNPKFDTIAQIVKIAGMEDVFNNEEITFFAPTDEVIRRTIGLVNSLVPETRGGLNQQLFDANKDTVKVLSDIPAAIWRKYLMKYMLKGKFLAKDFPQLDYALRPLYPGAYYFGYNGDLSNIGVVYNSANDVKYAGYRQLTISNVPDISDPDKFTSAAVATSDVQPQNGAVHVLAVYYYGRIDEVRVDPGSNNFGLGYEFNREVILNK